MGVYYEYSKLNEVILGISPKVYMQSELPVEMEAGMSWVDKISYRLGHKIYNNRALPLSISNKYQKELENLHYVLVEHGVKVHRLKPIEPMVSEPEGLIQMFARDPAMTVGNHFIFGNLQIPMRKKEHRGYNSLIPVLKNNGLEINSIDLDSNVYLEGGDVIIDYPYVFVGINTYATNMAGLKWLEKQLGDVFKVVPVYIDDPTIMHLDCCMTIIGPNLAIINKKSLKQPLPFPLNEYEFIEVDDKSRKELGTNVLVIDPKTIVVQERHKELQLKLKKKGFDVITIDFTNHAKTHGAFRCATCPLSRSDIY
ncbi:MAG: arginine deiminase [Vallitaleaceae bacterium]|nr:arginine deiminase [Vallitaleaceae bacterium]